MIYFIITLFSALLVIAIVPSIIYVAGRKLLFDDFSTERKTHTTAVSRFGGVAIFCSFMISCLLFSQISNYPDHNFILAASMILFVVGLKDDFWGVNPSTKFGAQLLAAAIIVLLADIRLTSLYGLFNVHDLSYNASVSLSLLLFVSITNAFNLIDGIDGLASMTGALVNICLGFMFISLGQTNLACIAFAMAGTCIGFLRYNLFSAKIFMGDTGALLIGFISIILAVKFIELNRVAINNDVTAPSTVVALFIIPAFDTVRIFLLRLARGTSPFAADRNHIHHRLLETGLSHIQATGILLIFNILMIALTFVLGGFSNFAIISLMFIICIFCNSMLTVLIKHRNLSSIS